MKRQHFYDSFSELRFFDMGGFGVTYQHQRSGLPVSSTGRHESGMPLEVEEERLEELQSAPGAEFVDFKRGRVKPRTIFNFSTGVTVFKSERIVCAARLDVLNIAEGLSLTILAIRSKGRTSVTAGDGTVD